MKKSVKPYQPTSSSTSLLLLFTALLLLLSQSSSANLLQPQPPPPPPPPSQYQNAEFLRQGLSMEKMRLGSRPPSCYSKCNGCHPCMAAQVPSGPVSHRARPLKNPDTVAPMNFLEPSPAEGRYSNYKPLGWKCRCRNHFYNP